MFVTYSSDDEAIASMGGIYGPMNGMGPGGEGGNDNMGYPPGPDGNDSMGYPPMGPGPMDPDEHQNQYEQQDQYGTHRGEDPPDTDQRTAFDDGKSVASGKSSRMGGAQSRLKQNRMKNM